MIFQFRSRPKFSGVGGVEVKYPILNKVNDTRSLNGEVDD